MRKIIVLLAAVVLAFGLAVANAESSDEWNVAPVIVKAYEWSAGSFYIEWKGYAPLYKVYVDGINVSNERVNHSVLKLGKGTHNIVIYPVNEIRDINTNISFNSPVGGLELDAAALGLDPKHLYTGNASDTFRVDYKPSQILNGKPEDLVAYTIQENKVVLAFVDQYNADEYALTIKHKNDINDLTYSLLDEEAKALVSKNKSTVSIILDPDYLRKQECMVPELDKEYKFTVQLRKCTNDLITGEKSRSVLLDSKVSNEYKYRVEAAWKTAPVISFASQIADGEIKIQWDHEDYDFDCEYAIMKINKVLGVMTGEEQLGLTKEQEYIVNDLNNGHYCFNIVPILNGDKGSYSDNADVEVKNDWVVAPELICQQTGENKVLLKWKVPVGVEQYHIVVSTGNNKSLLRFVDLDFSKYTEFDVDAVAGDMEYEFVYDQDFDPVDGVKMKFEIYGLRHAGSGTEQKSAVSSKTFVIKENND